MWRGRKAKMCCPVERYNHFLSVLMHESFYRKPNNFRQKLKALWAIFHLTTGSRKEKKNLIYDFYCFLVCLSLKARSDRPLHYAENENVEQTKHTWMEILWEKTDVLFRFLWVSFVVWERRMVRLQEKISHFFALLLFTFAWLFRKWGNFPTRLYW